MWLLLLRQLVVSCSHGWCFSEVGGLLKGLLLLVRGQGVLCRAAVLGQGEGCMRLLLHGSERALTGLLLLEWGQPACTDAAPWARVCCSHGCCSSGHCTLG